MEIGTEAALFPEKEHIIWNFPSSVAKVQESDLRELVLSAVGEEVLLQPPGLNGEEPGDGVRGDQDVLTAHTESAHTHHGV